MRYKHVLIGLITAMIGTGCGSLKNSIDQRVAVSEECRATLASPPTAPSTLKVAAVLVGNVGQCDIVNEKNLLPICALMQIRTRYGIAPVPNTATLAARLAKVNDAMTAIDPALRNWATANPQSAKDIAGRLASLYASLDEVSRSVNNHPTRTAIWTGLGNLRNANIRLRNLLTPSSPPPLQTKLQSLDKIIDELEVSLVPVIGTSETGPALDAFDRSVSNLESALTALAISVGTLDGQYRAVLEKIRSNNDEKNGIANYPARTTAMQDAIKAAGNLKQLVANVHEAHRGVKLAADTLSTSLSRQAQVELAAWHSNMVAQMAQLEQLLSGDFNLVFTAGVRNEVLTHVARRSLELFHGAIKPADAVISRLDDKAYGTVSVGYLVFGPNIQRAVNKGYADLKEAYANRLPRGQNKSEATTAFLGELKRAACDNLTQGTQFSMLGELLDTMLILQVGPTNGANVPESDHPQGITPNDAAVPLRHSGALIVKTRFVMQPDAVAGELSKQGQNELATEEATPLSVYTVNQWMARQQLLTAKIAASFANTDTSASGKPARLPEVETVDEGRVKELADAATSKAIDDAARLNPSMLAKTPVDVAPQIQNSVNVVNAAQAVSQAAAVLNANISVSNVNTYSPANYNMVAPVITVTAPTGATAGTGLTCNALDFGAAGVTCTDTGSNLVLGFSSRTFGSDSCVPADLEPALSALGTMISSYRLRSGVEYRATIQGYASLPSAYLAHCKPTTPRPASFCNYVNGLRETVGVAGCAGGLTDRNVALSAQRARVAAVTLERAANGALIVDGLQAFGAETAGKRGGGAPPAMDQTVLIRLTPRANR